MAKKLTIEEVRQFVHENSDCELLSTEYVNAREKLEFRCGCGEEFEASASLFRGRGKRQCNTCGWEKQLAAKEEQRNVARLKFEIELKKEGYIQIDNYLKSHSKIRVQCNNGHLYFVTPSNFIQGHRCMKCSGYEKKTTIKFFQDLISIHGKKYVLCSKYKGSNTKVTLFCVNCESFWKVRPTSVLRGSGCPRCASSKGETVISEFLQQYSIRNLPQFTFSDCRNKELLPFDFAVFSSESQEKPEFLIEYDGIQHFEPVDFFGGQEQFEKQQLHDRIKDDYCKQNGIELIRIPYWEQDNIEEILSEKLSRLITEDTERLEIAVL